MNWNNKIKVYVDDTKYIAYIASTEEDKIQGLSNVISLDPNEMLLFDYSNNPQDSLVFNTKEMEFPIDIVFINDDDEVVAIEYGEPGSEDIIKCIADKDEKLKYVLEVNTNSGIKIGDEIDFEEDDVSEEEINRMYILGPDGKPQMELEGGSRIISRKETKNLIKKAKIANKNKDDVSYKKLGKYMFKILKGQNERSPEYVSAPDNKKGE